MAESETVPPLPRVDPDVVSLLERITMRDLPAPGAPEGEVREFIGALRLVRTLRGISTLQSEG